MKYFRINHWKKRSNIDCIVFANAPYYDSRKGVVIRSEVKHNCIFVELDQFLKAIWANELLMDIRINKETYVHLS